MSVGSLSYWQEWIKKKKVIFSDAPLGKITDGDSQKGYIIVLKRELSWSWGSGKFSQKQICITHISLVIETMVISQV